MNAVHVILLCGGTGQRMAAGKNKVLLSLRGKSVARRSAEAFIGFADDMVVVCHEPDQPEIEKEIASSTLSFPVSFVSGGATRQASVSRGLNALQGADDDFVLVHDAARCLVDPDTIQEVIESAEQYGIGIPAVPVRDTIRTSLSDPLSGETVPGDKTQATQTPLSGPLAGKTIPRDKLRAMQTPQGFRLAKLRDAMSRAEKDGFEGTDDASLLEHIGSPVYLTHGSYRNIKLTTQEDLIMAEAFLQDEETQVEINLNEESRNEETCKKESYDEKPCNKESRGNESFPYLRVGQGYDVHRLGPDRKLILCGIEIPYEKGLIGHSDADVALHALMDAMLGAAALGDIGRHFPDTDAEYEGISSVKLLERVISLLARQNMRTANVDVTIVAQKPKLAPYIPAMKSNLARILSLPENRVNVKATTTERLGFEGRMEGISSQAVCLLQEI